MGTGYQKKPAAEVDRVRLGNMIYLILHSGTRSLSGDKSWKMSPTRGEIRGGVLCEPQYIYLGIS